MKDFKSNDKVFAKVKGYPPWPAKILNYNKNVKKYNVEFYGTKETALVKAEDLHYFITNKANFYENSKRKDFLEALKEIEKEVKEAGTDGNDIPRDIPSNDLVKPKEKSKGFGKRGRKRKLSINSENSSSQKKNADKTNESIISDGENLEISTTGQNTDESSNVESEKQIEEESDLENTSISKFTIISRSGRKIKANQRYSTEEEIIAETSKKVAKSLNATNDESKSLKSVDESAVLINNKPDEEIDNNTEKDEKINKENSTAVEIDDKTSEKGDRPFILVPTEHLEILVKYASIVKEKGDIFKKQEVEDFHTEEKKIVVVKLSTEEYIGILFNNEKMPLTEFKSEFDRAIYDEIEANRVLDLKSQLEQGTLKYDVNDVRFVPLDKEFVENDSISVEESLNRKKSKLKWLKAESKLLNCDCEIKAALGLEKAEPKVAYEYLNQLLELYVEPLMLKKQPQIFEVSKRLQGYVGNIHEWNMTREELIEFQDDAKRIRLKADLVFERFCSIMKDVMPAAKDLYKAAFWDAFVEEIDKFKQETAHLKENEVFVLYAEPNSRRTIIDNLHEEWEQMSTTAKVSKKVS